MKKPQPVIIRVEAFVRLVLICRNLAYAIFIESAVFVLSEVLAASVCCFSASRLAISAVYWLWEISPLLSICLSCESLYCDRLSVELLSEVSVSSLLSLLLILFTVLSSVEVLEALAVSPRAAVTAAVSEVVVVAAALAAGAAGAAFKAAPSGLISTVYAAEVAEVVVLLDAVGDTVFPAAVVAAVESVWFLSVCCAACARLVFRAVVPASALLI